MLLKTSRLVLRELTPADIPTIHELLSLPKTDEFNTLGIPDSIASTEKIVLEWL